MKFAIVAKNKMGHRLYRRLGIDRWTLNPFDAEISDIEPAQPLAVGYIVKVRSLRDLAKKFPAS